MLVYMRMRVLHFFQVLCMASTLGLYACCKCVYISACLRHIIGAGVRVAIFVSSANTCEVLIDKKNFFKDCMIIFILTTSRSMSFKVCYLIE